MYYKRYKFTLRSSLLAGFLSLIGSALLFLCLSVIANKDPATVRAVADGKLTDGALLIEESSIPPTAELPVAENVDLKEVVPDEVPAIESPVSPAPAGDVSAVVEEDQNVKTAAKTKETIALDKPEVASESKADDSSSIGSSTAPV